MRGAIPLLPQYAFVAWCSVKAQDKKWKGMCLFLTKSHNKQNYIDTDRPIHNIHGF
jgi:hypothetical protein